MSVSKKPRKAYKPKRVILDPVGYVLTGLLPVAEVGDKLITLRVRNHAAMGALARGQATGADFKLLIAALNMTEALMLQDMGARWRPQLQAGQLALGAISQRAKAIKRLVMRGEEMSALTLAMEVHDAQLGICTVAQIERAIHTVRKVLKSGQAAAI